MTKKRKQQPEPATDGPPDWRKVVEEHEGPRYAYAYVRVGDSQAVCAAIFDVTGMKPIKAHPPNPPGIAEEQAKVWMEMGEGRKWAK